MHDILFRGIPFRYFCRCCLTSFIALSAFACHRVQEPVQEPAAKMSEPDRKNRAVLDEANRAATWFHARKTRPIWVKQLKTAQVVRTLEGDEKVAAGNFLCRGEAGDVWPQPPASLDKRYSPTDETDSDGWRKYLPRPDAEGVMAVQLDHPFDVEAKWGKLSGKKGDFLLKKYEDRDAVYPDDVWIVDQTLFRQTYEPVPE